MSRALPLELAALAALAGCRSAPAASAAAPSPAESAPTPAPAAHDPAHPPIDCPLHGHGVDAASMRPFEDVEKYIAFLERPERAVWQKPDEVVAALGLRGDETVVDVGSGSGYFAFRFARALPRGRVFAQDVELEMVRHVHHKATAEGVENVQALLGRTDDPRLPAGVDVVFMCDVLHHVADRPAWLAKLAGEMKSGARLALVEFKEGKLPEGPPESMKLPRAELLRLGAEAGFVLREEKTDLLPYQTFLVFAKP